MEIISRYAQKKNSNSLKSGAQLVLAIGEIAKTLKKQEGANVPTLWNQKQEKDFFVKSLEVAAPEQLFYITKDKRYLAYWPKNYDGAKTRFCPTLWGQIRFYYI